MAIGEKAALEIGIFISVKIKSVIGFEKTLNYWLSILHIIAQICIFVLKY